MSGFGENVAHISFGIKHVINPSSQSYQLALGISAGMTSLHWNTLRLNFYMECANLTLRQNVEYRGPMLWLPILVLECSKGN